MRENFFMKNSQTLTFRDAIKANTPTAFTSMIKPVGASCNLRCDYCYYLDKEILHSAGVISDELLEIFIKDYIESNDVNEITFCWHGGEPLLAGLPFYQRAIDLQNKYQAGKSILNTLQTNGTLIDEHWAQFFAANNFLVGVSIDGPEAIHNARRGNSFASVMRGIKAMQKAGAEFNTLSAVSSAAAGKGSEVYDFLKGIGSQFMQFLPVSEFLDNDRIAARNGKIADWSITSRDWGRFMIDIFERWVISDVGQIYVQLFDATLANTCGVRAGICSLNESCGDALIVEHTGDVYSCDHFVYPDYKLGNIAENSLKTMFRSRAQFKFGADKHTDLSPECLICEFRRLCHGECPKHRDKSGMSTLCEGYKMFFKFTRPYFEYMRSALESGQPAAIVIPFARNRMGLTF